MSNEFSSYSYRNPAAFSKLEAELRQELKEFMPVNNAPNDVLTEIKRLQKLIENNTALHNVQNKNS